MENYKIAIYIIAILLCIVMMRTKTTAFKRLLLVAVFGLILYLMANFSLYNWDNSNYRDIFLHLENYRNGKTEPAYYFFNFIIGRLGVDYLVYRYIFIGTFLFILTISVSQITDNYGLFFLIYLLHPMFKDAEQLRMFAATSIVFWGIKYLYKDKNILKFIIIIFIAYLFHSSSPIFLMFLIFMVPDQYKKKVRNWLVIIVATLSALALLRRDLFTNIITALLKNANSTKANQYIGLASRSAFLVPLALFILNYLIVTYIYKSVEYQENTEQIPYKKWTIGKYGGSVILSRSIRYVGFDNISYIFDMIALSAIFTLPFIMMSLHFYRIGRSIFLFCLAFISKGIKSLDRSGKIIVAFGLLLLIIGYYWFDFVIFGRWELNYFPLFMKYYLFYVW